MKKSKSSSKPKCGLCGKTKNLTKTDCCGQWICNDEDKYVMFSYARNSCARNHRRLTLCAFHQAEGHEGNWKTCDVCKKSFETEIYVYYGTNEYNFEKLVNPPAFKPKHCTDCRTTIFLAEGGYSTLGGKYYCMRCSDMSLEKRAKEIQAENARSKRRLRAV